MKRCHCNCIINSSYEGTRARHGLTVTGELIEKEVRPIGSSEPDPSSLKKIERRLLAAAIHGRFHTLDRDVMASFFFLFF